MIPSRIGFPVSCGLALLNAGLYFYFNDGTFLSAGAFCGVGALMFAMVPEEK